MKIDNGGLKIKSVLDDADTFGTMGSSVVFADWLLVIMKLQADGLKLLPYDMVLNYVGVTRGSLRKRLKSRQLTLIDYCVDSPRVYGSRYHAFLLFSELRLWSIWLRSGSENYVDEKLCKRIQSDRYWLRNVFWGFGWEAKRSVDAVVYLDRPSDFQNQCKKDDKK